ncbi:hypothetical protein WKH57_00740 [Niallia taxi]|uniref:hypothetical protein n=1 Tax=Niallia taxi TaxID=2499688 RepID=UPI00316E6E40
MYKKGSGFDGSADIQVSSTANMEIIPDTPSDWQNSKVNYYKFIFKNITDCHVKVNNNTRLFLLAEEGFESNEIDMEIYSFVIEESGTRFKWIGYK